jgi:hypothetical protein
MKKITLFWICLLTITTMTSAQTNSLGSFKQLSTKTFSGIVTDANASRSNIMAYGSDNSLFTSGRFDTEFEGLTPVATSSYLMKSNSSLVPSWKIAIAGAAKITAIASDNDGGVYVAGTLADEVVFNSIDGKSATLTGYKETDAYTTDMCASFLAHYDKDGNLLKANTIVPAHDASLDATEAYFPESGEVYCRINGLVFENGKLYTSIVYCGQISNTDNSITIKSGSMDIEGGGWMFMSLKAAAVAVLDDNLGVSSFPITLASRPFTELYTSEQVNSFTMTGDNNHLYVGFIATGTEKFKSFDEAEKSFTFTAPAEGTNYGYGVADIDLSAEKTNAIKTWESPTTESYSSTEIDNIAVSGDNLILSGIFQDKFGFDNSITATGSNDIFAASLSKSDLSVNWAKATAYDEGDATKNEEIMVCSAIAGDNLYVGGYTSLKVDHSLTAPLLYSFNLKTGAAIKNSNDTYDFGMVTSADNKFTTVAYTTSPITGISFTNYDLTSGINSVKSGDNGITATYSAATGNVTFNKVCNAEIITADGKVVANVADAKSVNIQSLSNGMYFVRTTINGATSTVKIIK